MSKIKTKIIKYLKENKKGLDSVELSVLINVKLQSLTNPIKTLLDDGLIEVNGIHKSTVSNRMVQVYKYVDLKKIKGFKHYVCIKTIPICSLLHGKKIFFTKQDSKKIDYFFKKGKKYFSETDGTITDEFGIEHNNSFFGDWRCFFKKIN